MLTGLPGGGSVTAHVANCLPLGTDGKYYLVGAALYTHGNVWGISNPPADWKLLEKSAPSADASSSNASGLKVHKQEWPYSLFADGNETHRNRK